MNLIHHSALFNCLQIIPDIVQITELESYTLPQTSYAKTQNSLQLVKAFFI